MVEKPKFDLYTFHQSLVNDNLLLYKGPFNKPVLGVFQYYIYETLMDYPFLRKKIYSVFVELAQNIIYYSAEKHIYNGKPVGVGTLSIQDTNFSYVFVAGNLVSSANLGKFIDKCTRIQKLNKNELHEFKREQLRLPSGNNDTANIGLIKIALSANGSLDFIKYEVDPNHFFLTLLVEVIK